MMCQFCKQDVENPCQHTDDVQQRAENHVERCEDALLTKLAEGRDAGQGQSRG